MKKPIVRVLCILLLCFRLAPLSLAQQHTKPLPDAPKPNKRIFIIGVSALAASNVADAITMRQLLDRGGWENNPVFGRYPSPAKQAGINLAFFAGESAAFYLTEHNRHAWVRWTGRALLATATEEHARLAACNAGINTRSTVVQSCDPFPPGF